MSARPTQSAFGLLFLIFTSASPALAQDSSSANPAAPPAPPAAPDVTGSDGSSNIVVTALPSESSSIDRTTYVVRDTVESRSSSVLDILSHVPSIDVTLSGQLRLFGRSGVKILIDGREVANPLNVLRNLQGSQIIRIEVISNPSAQFSAQGTAGIINIIIRRSLDTGIGGSLTAKADSFGGVDVKASPTWRRGPLSLSGSLGLSRSAGRMELRRERYIVGPASELQLAESEVGTFRNHNVSLTGSLFGSYRLSDREMISPSLNLIHSEGGRSGRSDIQSFGVLADMVKQALKSPTSFDNLDYSLEYRRQGRRKGESLTVAVQRSTIELSTNARFLFDSSLNGPGMFSISEAGSTDILSFKTDYVRPTGAQQILTVGAAIQRQSNSTLTLENGNLALGGGFVSRSSSFEAAWTEEAAYVTYQFPLFGGKFLPGLRVEHRRYDLGSSTAGFKGPSGTNFFPTLHFERGLGKGMNLALSYSRRITWPNIGALNPQLRSTDSTTATVGNPLLRPEITDSYEAKLRAKLGKHDLGLTAFARRTHDLISNLVEVNSDGILVSRNVNLGELTSLGLDIALRGPLGPHFHYSVNANVSDESISDELTDPSLLQSRPQYSFVAQLEYRRGVQDKKGADHATLSFRHNGPVERGLFAVSASSTMSASWSHIITDRLSAIVSIDGIRIPKTVKTTSYGPSTLSDEFFRNAGPRVTAALTYSLGRPNQSR